MAYKFQLGAATLSGSLTQEGAGEFDTSLTIGSAVLSEADLEKLDDITDGAAAANKALVLDSSRNISNINRVTAAELGAFQANGAIDFNSQAMTSVDINSGVIDGVTIATSDITVGSGKTLNVSAGTLTTSATQKLAIMEGAGADVDIGGFNLRASTLTADSMTSGRIAIYGASGVLSEDSGLTFGNGFITGSISGSVVGAGMGQFADLGAEGLNVDNDANIGGALSAVGAISGSAALSIGGTVRFDGAADHLAVVANDSFYFFNADDNLMRKESMADYAGLIAGDGLAASSGVLAVGVDDSSIELNSDALRVKASGITNDMLAGSIVNGKLSNSTVSYGGVSLALGASDATPAFDLSDATAYPGDSSLVAAGALNAGSITSGFGNIDNGSSTLDAGASTLASLTVNGNTTITGDLTVTGTTVEINAAFVVTSSVQFEGITPDGNEITLTSADPSADRTITLPDLSGHVALLAGAPSAADVTYAEFALLDGGSADSSVTVADADQFIINDGGVMKQTAMSDLKSYMSDVAMDVATPADGGSFSIGMNVVADMGSDGEDTITLPASAASLIGKKVMIKAPSDCSAARYLTVATQASDQKIDGVDSIRLESPNAAISLIYVATDSWKVF